MNNNVLPYLLDKARPFRVLVVDDDPVHRAIESVLLSAEYEISEAASGDAALESLKNDTFDAVLLDKLLPGMDGDEVCRRIRQDLGEEMLPVIMVTSSSSVDDLSTSFQAGASDFIRKPYSAQELMARLNAATRHKRLTDQLDNAESILFALARMVEAKDENTGNHCSRLAHTAVVLGRTLGLGEDELMALRRGGVLHDVGKLGIPEHILLKPGALTDDEWAVMKQHTVIGANLVGGLRSMRLTIPIILHHHERWDGSGYPYGLAGEAIPLLARVFQIVDIYDALMHTRPYKKAFSRQEVIRLVREEAERGWRDPDITAAFLHIAQHSPDALEVPAGAMEDLGIALYCSIAQTQIPGRGM